MPIREGWAFPEKPNSVGGVSMSDDILLVSSKVKAAIQAKGCNTGGDAIGGLNMWVNWLIDQATARAKANGRKTVRAHDFISG